MRARCGILAGALVLAACGSSSGMAPSQSSGATASTAQPGAGARAACGPAGAQTLAVDRVARVYQSGGNVYGCFTTTGHTYVLGASARSIREGRAGPIALAGRYVAYGYARFGVDTVSATVVVRDLGNGRQVRSGPATTKPVGPEFFQSVASIVVKADGAVAWIGQSGSIIRHGSSEIEVDKADAHGISLLDSGSGIDPRSLRLHGSAVSWRRSGRSRSASLG
jgi:hypothetical protein